jgi:hypothetical protein
MKTTRTEFLTSLAAGVAAATLSPGRLLAAAAGRVPDAQGFQALVGETFRFLVPDGRGPVDLVLADFAAGPQQTRTTQFTLTLAAPGGERLKEGTYTVEQERTGTFQMFVVPTGQDAKGRTLYRADFNLLTTAVSQPGIARRR